MKLLKKNQIVIYAIAVLLMVAGYLNYSTNTEKSLQASSQNINTTSELSNVGDARLVSSNAVSENSTENNEQNSEESSQQNGSKEGDNKIVGISLNDRFIGECVMEYDTDATDTFRIADFEI